MGSLIALLVTINVYGQILSGTFDLERPPQEVYLLDTRGGDHRIIDTAQINEHGQFQFDRENYASGFYQLALHDTDRVDIILDPRERRVDLSFSGRPIQEHISIASSIENQRMWEFKMISRQSKKQLAMIQEERSGLDPADHSARDKLDSLELSIKIRQGEALQLLIDHDTSSYFSRVVRADQELTQAIPLGATAIKKSFDWTSDALLRSSVFSKAIMAWMQNAPQELPDGLISASDSLLQWTKPHPEAWDHTRSLLIRIFDQHGPDIVAQYLVDRYVTGPDALVPADEELLRILVDQLKVAVGAPAPDVLLPDPIKGDTLLLYDLLQKERFTLIFFYSSTCDHCHEQIPHLAQLYSQWKEQGFEMIGIALDADVDEFRSTLEQHSITWPSFSELIGWGAPSAKAFMVKATPSFFLLDRSGKIVSKPYDHIQLKEDLHRLMQ